MKPSTLASCTIANELLRRRTQLNRNHTTQSCLNSDPRVGPASLVFECTPAPSSSRSQILQQEVRRAYATGTTNSGESCKSVVGRPQDIGPGLRTITVQRWTPDMWKLGLGPDHKNGFILAAMRQDSERPKQTTNNAPQGIEDWAGAELPDAQGGAEEWGSSTGHEGARETTPMSPSRSPGSKKGIGSSDAENPFAISRRNELRARRSLRFSYVDSPTSDSTLYESATNSPCCTSKTGDIPWRTPRNSDVGTDLKAIPESILFEPQQRQTPTPVRRQWTRHQRDLSTDSSLSTIRTPIPLRVRAHTNDGLLQFKANASTGSAVPVSAEKTHRRKMSLNIPIKTPTKRAEGAQHQDGGNLHRSPHRTPTVSDGALRPLMHEERELEYKHRHTFIGTTSLDDFLEALEVSSTYSTTKYWVVRAFISLASNEQIHARQSSTRPDGWELVPRVTPDVSSIDYVAQLQVKLGSITLRQFLDMIQFDQREEVGALRVVEAFSAASHLDAQAGVGTGRKARAFRTWMVAQHHHVV
ncbi:hypothetical protein NX059_010182 [Plenodomus lindquistii]|nr:hypothetical protein NX059_010182 [Plenodomus lindquistii]